MARMTLRRSPRYIQRLPYRQQLLQHFTQLDRLERIRSVGLCLFGIVMHFQKKAIDSGRHGGTRQYWNELRLAAADRGDAIASLRRRKLHRMGRVENYWRKF